MYERLSEIRFRYETPSTTRTVQEEENARGDASFKYYCSRVRLCSQDSIIVN